MEDKFRNKTILAHLIMATMMFALLSGCVMNPDKQSSNSKSAKKDAKKTRSEGILVGMIIGGVLGKALGKNNKSAAMGMIVGGTLGYVLGDHVAKKKKAYKNDEDYLIAVAEQSDRVATESSQYNKALEQEIDVLLAIEKRLASQAATARRQNKSNKILKQRIAKSIEQTDKKLASLRNEIKMQNLALRSAKNSNRSQGFVRVSESKLILESQERDLILARAKLMSIDRRRVY